jgi:hypothetical protein
MSAICFSHAEVTSISRHGFWLQFGDEELYLAFAEFPLVRARHRGPDHPPRSAPAPARLYWPALDLDLSLEPMRSPMMRAIRSLGFTSLTG